MKTRSLLNAGRRHLPTPTGPYGVGCTDIMTGYTKNGSFFRLFYPLQELSTKEHYLEWPPWIPSKHYLQGYAIFCGIFPKLFQAFYSLFIGDIFIPARWQATISQESIFPVIVFSHGLGACRNAYSSICLELASYGFVVAAVEHRDHSACCSFYVKQARMSSYGEFPGSDLDDFNEVLQKWCESEWQDAVDGQWSPQPMTQTVGLAPRTKEWIYYEPIRKKEMPFIRRQQLAKRAKECSQALEVLKSLNNGTFAANVIDPHFRAECFKDRLDVKNAAVIGHSFGGATTILSLAQELQFRIGIALDPWMLPFEADATPFRHIQQPLVVVNTQYFQTKKHLQIMKGLQETQSKCTILKIKKAVHRDQTDVPFLGSPLFNGGSSRKSGYRTHYLTTQIIMCSLLKHMDTELSKISYKDESVLKKYIKEVHL